MGSKYAKLFFLIVGIIVISYFKYHSLKAHFEQSLPYISVEQVKKESMNYNEKLLRDIINVNQNSEVNEKKESIKLSAVGSVLIDADNGRVLYGKDETKELAMASTTKIMTCIIALEKADLFDIVTVSKYAAKMPDVQLNIVAGEQYYLGDLLYSLMLESHNDTAVAIAEHVGGSVEGFAQLMNAKAIELKCEHTNFVTPNGLDATGHYTTAYELAQIAAYAIKNENFVKITNSESHEFKELISGKKQVVVNKNRFLYMMDGAMGIKTGFTNNAGYCFVGAIRREDRTFISVVLGSGWPPHKTYKWTDTQNLMNYGLKHYFRKTIMNKRIDLKDIYVEDGVKSTLNAYVEGNLSLLVSDQEKIELKCNVPRFVKAPITSGSEIGDLSFYIDDKLYTRIPILTSESVGKTNFAFYLKKLLEVF